MYNIICLKSQHHSLQYQIFQMELRYIIVKRYTNRRNPFWYVVGEPCGRIFDKVKGWKNSRKIFNLLLHCSIFSYVIYSDYIYLTGVNIPCNKWECSEGILFPEKSEDMIKENQQFIILIWIEINNVLLKRNLHETKN